VAPGRACGYSDLTLIAPLQSGGARAEDRIAMAASKTIVSAAGTLLHSHGQWINRMSR
jgi:hypothetical protein